MSQRFPIKAVLDWKRCRVSDLQFLLDVHPGAPKMNLRNSLKDGLSVDRADALAVFLGRHPGDIWPEWYILADDEIDMDRADDTDRVESEVE